MDDIQKNWCGETGQNAFPKLNMLLHSLEFAERFRFLGRTSEAQIESYHYQFKRLYHQQHLNSAHNESQRICRSLADTTLRAVQPLLQQSILRFSLNSQAISRPNPTIAVVSAYNNP